MTLFSNQLIEDELALFDLIRTITEKVVSRYVFRTVIPAREKEDVEMAVIEKFLNKKEKINQTFEGKSKITTYYTAIINRMCCEIIRSESKHWYSVNDDAELYQDQQYKTLNYESAKKTLINDEVKRLANTMLFFNGEREKVNLCLKYFFDIPLDDEDIRMYSQDKHDKLKLILEERESLSKAEVFKNLSKVVNIVENKNVGGDAIRIWLNKRIDTILNRMNTNGLYFHNKESLSVLIEMQIQYKRYNAKEP